MRDVLTRTGRALAYLATGLPAGAVGLAWSLVAALGTTLTSFTHLGGHAFLGAAWVTRLLAGLERRRAGWVLGTPIETPYLPITGDRLRERVASAARQPASWRDLAWLVLSFPAGLVTGVAGIVVAVVGLGAVVAPAWAWAVPNPHAPWPMKPLLTTVPGRFGLTVLGLALLPVTLWLVRVLARGPARLSAALLSPGEHRRLVDEATRLAETRRRVVDAQAAELRRIERDLHDGAQARIVAAGMTLALAARKLRADGDAAPDVDLARRQLDDALGELRRLVRGIHPPILTDRGLHAALAALAGDSPFPVALHGDPGARCPAAVESAAYFVVAEGLTNAAKHAGATAGTIEITRTGNVVRVSVGDNGRGGADPAGPGIDGLRRRVDALDGVLTLTSPPGGPTLLRAELPCAS
ncbi:sensor histidine kinase [Actinoplanes sp. NPDC051513]|uniref:sensor histidine kinase n=1 Tax=Actinoplanes sp. NPDC051513 TaxID=3363908 RepID=UPI0037888DCD